MSRTGGEYTLPLGDVVTNTTISISWANTTLGDLETEMTDSLSRTASGGMLAQLALNEANLVGTPDLSWTSEPSSGLYLASPGNIRFSLLGVDLLTMTAESLAVTGVMSASIEDAATDTVTTALTLTHTTSGTPANDLGVGMDFVVECGTGNEIGAQIEAEAVDITGASEDFDLVFNLMTAGAAAAEVARFQSTGELDLASGGEYHINGALALSATALGADIVIGGASPAAGTFTTLNATGGGALTGTWTDLGTVTTVDIDGGTIDGVTIENSAIGVGTQAAGSFTTLTTTGAATFGAEVVEKVFAIPSSTTPELDPADGTVQTWTLTGVSTPTDVLATGEFLTLHIDDGSGYTIVWTSVVDKWIHGTAPTLDTTDINIIELWKVGATVYGSFVGVAAAP